MPRRTSQTALIGFGLILSSGIAHAQLDLDSDGDGRSDDYERRIGTNPFGADPDLDGDGIPDAVEIRMHTDPASPDSDGDGTNDGNEDHDGDGVGNFPELEAGTDPFDSDSDDDELNDQEDLRPLNPDVDGDGIIDGRDDFIDQDGDGIADEDDDDPTNADIDADGVIDGQDTFLDTPQRCRDVNLGVKRSTTVCIDGTWHHVTQEYWSRRCEGEPHQLLVRVLDARDTGEKCVDGQAP